MKIRVIAADDFPLVREGIVRALNRDPAIEVTLTMAPCAASRASINPRASRATAKMLTLNTPIQVSRSLSSTPTSSGRSPCAAACYAQLLRRFFARLLGKLA